MKIRFTLHPASTISCLVLFLVACPSQCVLAQPAEEDVRDGLHRSVSFFRSAASAGGGYVYQLSADLSKREGEGKVGATTAWIQPPGTPAVGMAYLSAYRKCGDQVLLEAARETAGALVRGQLRSGGWDNKIEFDPEQRKKYAYRVEPDDGKKRRNVTTFDDDKSQSVIRFLMQLDRELDFKDDAIHDAVMYALDAVLKSQYANGAWPQRYDEFPKPSQESVLKASLPETWSRKYPGTRYGGFYTLNDNTMGDLIETMLDAWEVYDDDRYLKSARRGGDFFLSAQLPEPQPGWVLVWLPVLVIVLDGPPDPTSAMVRLAAMLLLGTVAFSSVAISASATRVCLQLS